MARPPTINRGAVRFGSGEDRQTVVPHPRVAYLLLVIVALPSVPGTNHGHPACLEVRSGPTRLAPGIGKLGPMGSTGKSLRVGDFCLPAFQVGARTELPTARTPSPATRPNRKPPRAEGEA